MSGEGREVRANAPSLGRALVLAVHLACGCALPVLSAAQEVPSVRHFRASDIDASVLRPHRLVYDAVPGPEGAAMFSDGALLKPQISITLDRTIYQLPDGEVRDAIRVRWVSNTHPHPDELVVDARTLSTVKERTRTGPAWDMGAEILHVRERRARVVRIRDGGATSDTTFALEHPHYYGVMILPYLFSSIELEPRDSFLLPAIGSSSESTIQVDVVGPTLYQGARGEEIEAQLVTTRHSWGSIDWFVGPDVPYHLHAVWHFGEADSVVSQVVDFAEFPRDQWVGTVDRKVLRRRVGND